MASSALNSLFDLRGIGSHYTDAWGHPATVEISNKTKVLAAMGYPVDNVCALEQSLLADTQKVWTSPLPPVQVNRISQDIPLNIKLSAAKLSTLLRSQALMLQIHTEQGENHQQALNLDLVQSGSKHTIDGHVYQAFTVCLAPQLACGYHTVKLVNHEPDHSFTTLATMRLIVAPETCYHPAPIASGNKVWGLSAQLYCLRSKTNWGIGDFSDLAYLVEKAAKNGAQFIGLNPIHALYAAFPDSCSPYSPSSRRWLNFIYLDVTAIHGYNAEAVQTMVQSHDFQTALEQARQTEQVDYATVTELKLKTLNAIFSYQNEHVFQHDPIQSQAFAQFIKSGGESLEMLAVFEALQEQLADQGKPAWGWPAFPVAFREFHLPAVTEFKHQYAERVRFYMFLQWQTALQLERVNKIAQAQNMQIGLYRDLAVGVSEGSAEVWGNQDLYCTGVSVGAPPDILGPLGQNWGLPPMDPKELQKQAYQPIIELFDANMQSSGAVRIDHVMALLRLWWVPKGDDAKHGAYVNYPVDDLLGILALESHRHKCLVIGEDLGTVPEEISIKLKNNGVYSYRVFIFEHDEEQGFRSPADYPTQSMSTITTHDMPTLKGFWHNKDLQLGEQLGLYPTDEILAVLKRARQRDKQNILDSLQTHGSWLPSHEQPCSTKQTMDQTLNYALQVHLAKGSSALMSLQLEDWLQMDSPVNIPGTFKEYPNWKRKLNRDIEDIFSDPDITTLTQDLTLARIHASGLNKS